MNNDQDSYTTNRMMGDDDVSSKSSVWLVSFTDVIALMLTFFVLLYSMSSPDTQKWEYKVGVELSPVAEYSGAPQNAGVNEGQNINRIDYNNAEDRDYVEALLREVLNRSDIGNNVEIRQVGADVQLVLSPSIFGPGGMSVNDDSRQFFRQLSPVLGNLDNQIKIVSSLQSMNNGKGYAQMQLVAAALKKARYRKPISIGMVGNKNIVSDGQISILIQPHDGRRITR